MCKNSEYTIIEIMDEERCSGVLSVFKSMKD